MQAIQGSIEGAQRLSSRFASVALEYIGASDQPEWKHVPHIIFMRDPPHEEKLHELKEDIALLESYGHTTASLRFTWNSFRSYLVNNMRQRLPEIMAALSDKTDAILPNTIQRLGFRDHIYALGVQLQPSIIPALQKHDDFYQCEFRPVQSTDAGRILRYLP